MLTGRKVGAEAPVLKLMIATVIALIGTIPSQLFAARWVRQHNHAVGEEGVIPVFLKHAPSHLKFAVIGMNFVLGGLLFAAVFVGLSYVLS